jgi:hypothetical protein
MESCSMPAKQGATRRLVLVHSAASILIAGLAGPAVAKDAIYTSLFSDLALRGYDPVAYFTDGRPVQGSSAFELAWQGAHWRFASAEHRDIFAAEPTRYAPRYGGYCAWAVAQGTTASGDPLVWKIVNGRLYVNYNADVQTRWEADIPGNVAKADENWPKVLKK